MFKGSIIAAALSLCALPLAAAGVPIVYECEYTAHTSYGWIPDKAAYVVDEAAGTAMAYDAYIHHVNKAPLPVTFSVVKERKYLMKWTLTGLPVRGNRTATATYTVRLDAARSKATIGARVHGGDGSNRGTGTCQRVK